MQAYLKRIQDIYKNTSMTKLAEYWSRAESLSSGDVDKAEQILENILSLSEDTPQWWESMSKKKKRHFLGKKPRQAAKPQVAAAPTAAAEPTTATKTDELIHVPEPVSEEKAEEPEEAPKEENTEPDTASAPAEEDTKEPSAAEEKPEEPAPAPEEAPSEEKAEEAPKEVEEKKEAEPAPERLADVANRGLDGRAEARWEHSLRIDGVIGQGALREVADHVQRVVSALAPMVAAQRDARVVEADPGAGHQLRVHQDEPAVGAVLGRAGLARHIRLDAVHVADAAPGAAVHGCTQHVDQLNGHIGLEHTFVRRCGRRRELGDQPPTRIGHARHQHRNAVLAE